MHTKYASFDLADQEFKFYTALEWHNLIADCREELLAQEEEDADLTMPVEELLEYFFGDEFFWAELPA